MSAGLNGLHGPMALKPRNGGEFPLNRTVPLDEETDARLKELAAKSFTPATVLIRQFIREGLDRMTERG